MRIFALLKLFARESLAILHSKTLVAGIAPDDAIHFVSIVAQVCPLLVLDHIALFRKMFIDATAQGITGEAAAFTASRLISIFAAVLPLFGCANVTVESYTCGKYGLDPMFVRDLELRLMDMTLKLSQEVAIGGQMRFPLISHTITHHTFFTRSRQAAGGAVKCLCAVVRSLTKKHWNIIRLLDKCMEYLETQTKAYATSDDSSMPLLSQKTALSIQRALLIVGLLAKHYTFEEGADALIADVLPDAPVAQVALAEKYRGVDVVQAVFDLLMQYALPTVAAFSASDVQTAGIEAVGINVPVDYVGNDGEIPPYHYHRHRLPIPVTSTLLAS